MAKTIESVAKEIHRMLDELRPGTVLAVWPDGGVSAHRGLGPARRVTPEGLSEEPVATFVQMEELLSLDDIERMLRWAVTQEAPPSFP